MHLSGYNLHNSMTQMNLASTVCTVGGNQSIHKRPTQMDNV